VECGADVIIWSQAGKNIDGAHGQDASCWPLGIGGEFKEGHRKVHFLGGETCDAGLMGCTGGI
jgi:hypothetical protein